MKKNILMIMVSLVLGIGTTFFILNKSNIYAKEEYMVYAFQIGAFSKMEDAQNIAKDIPTIVVLDNDLYHVYGAIYKDMELVNMMLEYFKNNNYEIYLKMINVNQNFYDKLTKFEELAKQMDFQNNYKAINQSILNLYLESMK